MTGPIILETRGTIAYLTLNRPEVGNAINVPLARALLDAVVKVDEDKQVRSVVVRGNGRMFCAGGDVAQLHEAGNSRPDLLKDIIQYLHPAIACLAKMKKPVITAIHGPSAGAGVGLAAVGDIALAEPSAHFTMAYSKIGLSPDGGATWLLPRLIGFRRAQELALMNRRVSADEAAAMGLITRVVPDGTLAREVEALAEALSDSAIEALGKTKHLLRMSANATLEAQLDAECKYIAEQGGSSESDEGILAFVERRKPNFRSDGQSS